jgi:hypothetical protein
MENIISAAILIATLYGGTMVGEKIYHAVRMAALAKAAQGLPKLSPFAHVLTRQSSRRHVEACNRKQAEGNRPRARNCNLTLTSGNETRWRATGVVQQPMPNEKVEAREKIKVVLIARARGEATPQYEADYLIARK